MQNTLPKNSGDILNKLDAQQALPFSRGIFEDLTALLSQPCRPAAENLSQELERWEQEKHKESMDFYREDFDPLIDFFFDYHGTDFAPSVTLLTRVAAYAIKRINAFERKRDGSAPVLPDDVREVDGRDVYEALYPMSVQLSGDGWDAAIEVLLESSAQ